MVTANILNRTLFIKAAAYGSAVAIDVDGSEYVVTARHLLGCEPTTSIKVKSGARWVEHQAIEVGRAPGEIDIAVLQLDAPLVRTHMPAPADMAGLALGQDVFFIGFPYKLEGAAGLLEGQRPLPYVKKGCVSMLDSAEHPALVLDAINNEGFSGGPVVFAPPGQPQNYLKIAAIVSKFRTELTSVSDEHGRETGGTVPYNTGFLYAYGIGHALDLIRRRPPSVEVPQG